MSLLTTGLNTKDGFQGDISPVLVNSPVKHWTKAKGFNASCVLEIGEYLGRCPATLVPPIERGAKQLDALNASLD